MMLDNLWSYCWQVAGLIAGGLAVIRMLRVARPLLFLQVLLGVVLLLPVLQRWERPMMVLPAGPVFAPMAAPAGDWVRVNQPAVNWPMVVMLVLGLGVAARLIWVLVGLMQLRNLRWGAEMVTGDLGVSAEVAGPVTFGWRRPVILVPPAVMAMPSAMREAILAHERAHVRRRDWVFALLEEVILCVLWFHPAVWVLVGRIRLVREQVVDWEASRAAGSREVYVDALLAVAGARMQPYFAPAPPFLRRRQLASRIQSLVEEGDMSRFRLLISYGAAVVLTAGLGYFMTTSFPLAGAPQIQHQGITVHGAELVFGTPAVYPATARRAGVEGPVTLEVTIAGNGEVADARVISGAQELRKAALDAVLQWQFKAGGGVAQVVMEMRAPAEDVRRPKTKVVAITVSPLITGPLAETLRTRLAPFVGQEVTTEMSNVVRRLDSTLVTGIEAKRAGDEVELRVTVERPGTMGGGISVPGRIRVGGAVQAANRMDSTQPEYPPLAKQARIQGTVRFNIGIDRGGGVVAMEVVNGHPLLIPAASEAVKQYRYKPTMLNGQPVEVSTQVDVIFTL